MSLCAFSRLFFYESAAFELVELRLQLVDALAELLDAVRANSPAATSEVAEEVDMSRQGADARLRQLREHNRVENKKIGASLVWFSPDE